MPIDFLSRLTPEQQARIKSRQEALARDKAESEKMTDTQLADHMEYCLKNCDFRHRFQPGEPVYDGAMAHVFIPELIKRLRRPATEHDIFIVWHQVGPVVTALCWRSTETDALTEMGRLRAASPDTEKSTLWVSPLGGV